MTFRTDDRGGLLGRAREHFDWMLFIMVATLAVVGVINLYSATSVARNAHSEDYIQQIYWLVGGGIIATLAAVIDYRHYERLGYAVYAVGVVLLTLVFILGREIRGAGGERERLGGRVEGGPVGQVDAAVRRGLVDDGAADAGHLVSAVEMGRGGRDGLGVGGLEAVPAQAPRELPMVAQGEGVHGVARQGISHGPHLG